MLHYKYMTIKSLIWKPDICSVTEICTIWLWTNLRIRLWIKLWLCHLEKYQAKARVRNTFWKAYQSQKLICINRAIIRRLYPRQCVTFINIIIWWCLLEQAFNEKCVSLSAYLNTVSLSTEDVQRHWQFDTMADSGRLRRCGWHPCHADE